MNRVIEGTVYDRFIPDPGRAEFEGAEAFIGVTADIARTAAGEVARIRNNARAAATAVSHARASRAVGAVSRARPVRRARPERLPRFLGSGPFDTFAGAAVMYCIKHARGLV